MFQIGLKLQNAPAGTSLDLLSLHESRSKLFIFCFLQALDNVYITILLFVGIIFKTKRLVVGCGFCKFGDPLNL